MRDGAELGFEGAEIVEASLDLEGFAVLLLFGVEEGDVLLDLEILFLEQVPIEEVIADIDEELGDLFDEFEPPGAELVVELKIKVVQEVLERPLVLVWGECEKLLLEGLPEVLDEFPGTRLDPSLYLVDREYVVLAVYGHHFFLLHPDFLIKFIHIYKVVFHQPISIISWVDGGGLRTKILQA